jgi:hypothetical protein
MPQLRIRYSQSPWRARGPGFPRAWVNGLLLPRTTLRSRAYLPDATERMAIGADAYPFWHVLDYPAVAGLASADGQILPEQDFTLLALMGVSQQLAGLRTEFYQVISKDTGLRMSNLPVNNVNLLGTGQEPFFLRRPYPMPNQRAVLNRMINRAAVANTAQVVLYGMKQKGAEN